MNDIVTIRDLLDHGLEAADVMVGCPGSTMYHDDAGDPYWLASDLAPLTAGREATEGGQG
jgi:hypothetical protein